MKIKPPGRRSFLKTAPLFCSITVLATFSMPLLAGPTVQFSGDKNNMVQSGKLGYVGGNTRIGVSIDKNSRGQADLSQVLDESDQALTSADLWLGYQLKDKDAVTKGAKGGGIKLNRQWVADDKSLVHKIFGAYDRDKAGHAKATVGYGQETEDLFWSGHVSKGLGKKDQNGDIVTKAYDYGVGVEAGKFIEDSLTRIRGGFDYEFANDYNDAESRPSQLSVSAGVEQFFQDSPHSISLDVSGSKTRGGSQAADTDYNARLGYHYEFGGNGVFQSANRTKKVRVEIPGTPGRPAIPAIAGRPAQAAIPAKYERRPIKRPGYKLVKNTMKLENETFFEKNSSRLTPSAIQNLDKITQQIRSHGYIGAIRITGNTCGLGSASYDQKLSERRAKEVRDYLAAKGINPRHLIARGLGKNHPKYVTKDTGFKNRRVDIEYVVERSVKKKIVEYRNVLVQPGRPAIPAQPGRPAVPATPATPARYVWNTEVVKTAPVWIKRALHNSIRHNKTVSTYSTRVDKNTSDDRYTITAARTTLDVLANDSSGLMLARVTQPANGHVTIEGNRLVYVPNPGFSGTDTFTYTVTDPDGKELTSTVTLNVPNVINSAPTATQDQQSIQCSTTPVSIDVLANDTDLEGDVLTLKSATNGQFGTTQIVNGELVYTPAANACGKQDSFSYTIVDSKGNEASATVTVDIAASGNQPPVAVDDSATTPQGIAVTLATLANDSDPDSDTLVITQVDNPAHGTATISGGQIVYTPDASFVGTETFDYTITDNNGHTVTATETVVVTATSSNTAPQAYEDQSNIQCSTNPVTIDVLSNDDDPEGDPLTIQTVANGQYGTTQIVNNNVVYTPSGSGCGQTDTFTYTINDGNGNTSSSQVTVLIEQAGNQAPDAVNDKFSVTAGSVTDLDVLANDTDPDGGNVCVSHIPQQPVHGWVEISTNGDYVTFHADSGYSGSDSFIYTACDDENGATDATVDLTITP